MYRIFLAVLVLVAANLSFAETVECRLVGGVPSTFMVQKFKFIKNADGKTSDFNMSTTKGSVNYSNVECKVENTPDAIYSCEHDDFVMIVALDESPLKAVINPIVYDKKEHGPFFYICK